MMGDLSGGVGEERRRGVRTSVTADAVEDDNGVDGSPVPPLLQPHLQRKPIKPAGSLSPDCRSHDRAGFDRGSPFHIHHRLSAGVSPTTRPTSPTSLSFVQDHSSKESTQVAYRAYLLEPFV